MGEKIQILDRRLRQIQNIQHAISLLGWDQQTYMPPAGAEARGEQTATLGLIAHDMSISPETGDMIAAAEDEAAGLDYESDAASLVRVARRDYDQVTKIPGDLVVELARHESVAYRCWNEAKQSNDYASYAPYLEKTVEYSRRLAEHLGYEDQPYDALLDLFEPGMKTAQVQSIFADLKTELVPLVRAIVEHADRADDSVLHGYFDEGKQEAFGLTIAKAYGYDLNRGRQDRTAHPFQASFSRNDVRITTRFEPDFFSSAFFSTLHETGHALYEQGVAPSIDGTPLGTGGSLALHESQSRMWENVVGRSLSFWRHYYPSLQQTFQETFGSVDVDTFYRAVNKVEPSLIRIEADEVTYNLHIMVRLEMELALLSGDVSVQDAPGVWNDKIEQYLGVRPPNDSVGILQDVHWSSGIMGYFTTYALGNILSIQLFDTAVRERPEIPAEISRGEFETLRGWLEEKLYRHGRKFEPNELVQRITGEPIQTRSYMAYLKRKFGEMYGL